MELLKISSIDLYIEQASKMDGGLRITKCYLFVSDGLVLVQKSKKDFIGMKNRIQKCKEFQFLVENENITKILKVYHMTI